MKHAWFLLILTLAPFTGAYAQDEQPCRDYDNILTRIQQAYDKGDLDVALEFVENLRACAPTKKEEAASWNKRILKKVQDQNARIAREKQRADDERDRAEANAEEARKKSIELENEKKQTERERNNARINAERAEKLVQTIKLDAVAGDVKEYDPTLAIMLADKACEFAQNHDELSVKIRRSIWENPYYVFYQASLEGHANRINAARYSAKGHYIVTASWDGYLGIWDSTGVIQQWLQVDNAGLLSLALSPDEQYIAAGAYSGFVYIYDMSGNLVRQFPAHTSDNGKGVYSLDFSPDGRYLLTGGGDHKARLWDWQKDAENTPKIELGLHRNVIYAVAFSPDGKKLLTASLDNTARIWDNRGVPLQHLKGHANAIFSACFSPDGKFVFTGSRDRSAKLWDAETGAFIRNFQGHTDEVTAVAFMPDGRRLLTAGKDGIARVWDLYGDESKVLRGHSRELIAIAAAPDNRHVVTAGADQTAKCWDLGATRFISTGEGHSGAVKTALFLPDGKTILTAGADKTARVWDLKGRQTAEFKGESEVHAAAISPDGNFIVTAGRDNTCKIWRNDGIEAARIAGHESDVMAVAFSPDSRQILTGSLDLTVRLWDLKGRLQRTFQGHTGEVFAVAWAPNGRHILSAGNDSTARLWPLVKGETKIFRHDALVSSCIFFADDKHFATGDYLGNVTMWEINGAQKWRMNLGVAITSLALSPDGQQILAGVYDNQDNTNNYKTTLLSAEGAILLEMRGHQGLINSVAFSPGGKTYLTGSEDQTAILWDHQGEELQRFKGHNLRIFGTALSPEADRIATLGLDASVREWSPNGRELHVYKATSQPVCIAYTPRTARLVTGFFDGSVELRSPGGSRTGGWAASDDGLYINALTCSPDERTLYTAFRDGGLRAWSLTGEKRWETTFSASLGALVCTPGGDTLLAGGYDGVIYLIDKQGREMHRFDSPLGIVTTLALSHSGRYLAAGSMSDTVGIYDLSTGKWLRKIKAHKGYVTAAAFSPDDHYLLTGGGVSLFSMLYENGAHDNALKLWSFDPRDTLAVFPLQVEAGGVGAAFFPGGDTLFTGNNTYFSLYYQIEKYLDSGKTAPISVAVQQELEVDLSQYDDPAVQNKRLMEQERQLIESMEEELAAAPDDPYLQRALADEYINLAWYAVLTKQPETAVASAQKALQIAPSQTWAYTNLALGYLCSNQWEKAEAIYLQWSRVDWSESGFPDQTGEPRLFLNAFLEDLDTMKAAKVECPLFGRAEEFLRKL